jgi:unsaturated rhamnogalacturonyl hydrolase
MDSQASSLPSTLESLAQQRPEQWERTACGVTRSMQSIPALLDRHAYSPTTDRVRVLIIGGLSGQSDDATMVLQALEHFASEGDHLANRIALSAVPCVNFDILVSSQPTESDTLRNLATGYPPEGNFYYDADAPEKRYIWRWACFQAPDLVLEIRSGDVVWWEANDVVGFLPLSIGASDITDSDSLLGALGLGRPDGLGPIPGLRLTARRTDLPEEMGRLWQAVRDVKDWTPSPARLELDRRRSRSHLDVGRILAAAYGHKLDPVVYTQGVAISGRLRLARLAQESDDQVSDVTPVVEAFLSGERDPFEEQPGGSTLGGVMWAYDLARRTGDQRAYDLLIRAADYVQARGAGEAPTSADPDFRVEDMFNISAILGRAFRLSGDQRYLEVMKKFLLESNIQQGNGLFWHCRSAPYFWGRGNGFAALGFAEALTYLPQDDPQRDTLVGMHLKHLEALREIQQPSGMYWQMLDVPGSYQEFTSTCMIGYSMVRGLRRGWLDPSYRDSVELAWQGVSERIDDEGNLVDACISTGVQKSVKEYLDRPAVFGLDDRSGALALWFAVEMERLRRGD